MVCHPSPPPLAPVRLVAQVMHEYGTTHNLGGTLHPDDALWSPNDPLKKHKLRGFTVTGGRVLVSPHQPPRHRRYLVRTAEEGWVVIDAVVRPRLWKRLGWLDWIGSCHKEGHVCRTVCSRGERSEKVVEMLNEMTARDDDWIWGDDGWRQEAPMRIPQGSMAQFKARGMYG